MSVILMTTLFYKALILQGEIWCWSLLGLKGLKPNRWREKRVEIKILKVNMMLQWKALILDDTAVRLPQLDKRQSAKHGAKDSNSGKTNTQVLK